MGFLQWIQKQSVAYTVYGIALAAMAILLAFILAKLFFVGSKNDRLNYLKNYKKGQFILIYVISVPLYFFGRLHLAEEIKNGTDILTCFLKAITLSVGLVKLDFGMDKVVEAMQADSFYYATMTICYVITIFNVLLFSASLVWQRLKNLCKKAAACRSKNLFVVVGGNEHNILLLDSLKKSGEKKARGLMFAKPDASLRDKLYLNGVCYAAFDCENSGEEAFYKKIKSFLGWRYCFRLCMRKNVTVLINTEDDEKNLLYVKALNRLLRVETHDVTYKRFVDVPVNAKQSLLTGYAFCKIENQSVFGKEIKEACGHIELLNRYEQIAFDFIMHYPLTRYMTEKQIIFTQGLLKDDADVNVCLVGFGSTNRQIFLKTVSDAQFFTKVGGKILHKKVHYYVFDKEAAHNDKNLNQTYFRYSLEFYKEYKQYRESMSQTKVSEGSEKWDYLPLPDYPADDWFNPEGNGDLSEDSEYFKEHFCKSDINSYEFYDRLKCIVSKKNAYTYIIVAFGEDLENIDLGKKITARLGMWKKASDAHVFVKVRGDTLIGGSHDDGIVLFGSTKSVYDIGKIVKNPIRELAYLKSFKYAREQSSDGELRRQMAIQTWMVSSPEQKASNYYSCLNLRTKLNLLGFDYIENSKEGADATKIFYQRYYGTTKFNEIDGQTLDAAFFRNGSVRTLLAMQEHQRWNANYICDGVIPPKKREIDGKGSGKDMEKRLIHYNLTTFEGLEEYRAISGNEVRHYDYRIMDNADKILADAGYKIVEKISST